MKFHHKYFATENASLVITIIVGIFLISNLVISAQQSIWLDETFTLNTTNQNPGNVIKSSLQMEMQPPFYFVVLRFWRIIDDGYTWARILSVIFVSIAIFFFYKLILLHNSDKLAIKITALFALNPFSFWAAQEIRVYGLSILLLIVQEYLFSKYYLSESRLSTRQRLLFILISVLSISTNFYLAFPLLANFGVLLLLRSKKTMPYLIDMILPVICVATYLAFMPWKEIRYYQMTDHSHMSDIYDQHFINLLSHNIQSILIKINLFVSGWERYDLPVFGEHNYHLYIAGFVYVLVIYRVITNRKELFSKRNLIFFAFLCFLTLIMLLQYFIVRGDAMVLNHSYYLYPPLLAILMYLIFIKRDMLSRIMFIFLVSVYVARISTYYSTNRKSEGLVQIADYINNAGNDKIIAYKNLTGHTFDIINGSRGTIYYLPAEFDFKSPLNQNRYVINSKNTIDSFLIKNNLKGTLWLITDHSEHSFVGIDFNYNLVNEFFRDNHIVLYDSIFSDEYRLQKIKLSY